MKQTMNLIPGVLVAILMGLCLVLVNTGYSEEATISVDIEVIQNEDNLKKPSFQWPEIEGATNYAFYVRDEIIYSGISNFFPPTEEYPYEEFAYGYYQAYLIVTLESSERQRTERIDFVIGMEKPTLLTLTEGIPIYELTPEFKWTTITGATGYEVFLDENMIYEGTGSSFLCEDPVDFGKHTWAVVAKNEFQRIRSDRGQFQLIRIDPPLNLSPANDFVVLALSTNDIPAIRWDKVAPRAEGEITYELYLDNEKVYEGPETSWEAPEMLERKIYTWYVKAKVFEQSSEPSDTWAFTLRDKLGVDIGVMLGGNMASTNNDNSKLRVMFNLGAYIDKRIFRKELFELRAQLDLLYEMRRVGFNEIDNYQQLENLTVNTAGIGIPLMLKPKYLIELEDVNKIQSITIYGLVGMKFTGVFLRIFSRKEDKYKETVKDYVNNIAVDLVTAAGALFLFDIDYLFDQKLQLFVEVRMNWGFTNFLDKMFLGTSSKLRLFNILIGNKIFDF